MQLNADDGGKRQCILCTNNENGICENVTYERNKRVIQGYTKPNGEEVEGLHANNLRYYRTDFVGRRRTPQNMRRLMLLASDMLCIKESLYTEHDEFGGMETLKTASVISLRAIPAALGETLSKLKFPPRLHGISPTERSRC